MFITCFVSLSSIFVFDYVSTFFVMLLLILLPINYIISWTESNSYYYSVTVLFIYLCISLCFIIVSIVYFFAIFEFIVVVMFMLLLISVNSLYRIRSAFWLFVYSLVGSCSIVVGMCCLGFDSWLLLFVLFVLFLVNVPCWPFSFWLPEVHAEASTSLSLVLAALLLNLGLFGLLSFVFVSLVSVVYYVSLLLLVITLVSLSMLSFYYFSLYDFKNVIAISSILHLNFSLVSLFSLSYCSYLVVIMNSIAHGFSSFSLFMLFGFLINRSYSRFVDCLYFVSLSVSVLVFAFLLVNMSFPLSFNFVVELLLFVVLSSISVWLGVSIVGYLFSSCVFYFVLFNRMLFMVSGSIGFGFVEYVYSVLMLGVIIYFGALCLTYLYFGYEGILCVLLLVIVALLTVTSHA